MKNISLILGLLFLAQTMYQMVELSKVDQGVDNDMATLLVFASIISFVLGISFILYKILPEE